MVCPKTILKARRSERDESCDTIFEGSEGRGDNKIVQESRGHKEGRVSSEGMAAKEGSAGNIIKILF